MMEPKARVEVSVVFISEQMKLLLHSVHDDIMFYWKFSPAFTSDEEEEEEDAAHHDHVSGRLSAPC